MEGNGGDGPDMAQQGAAADQLAELQILTRADHNGSSVRESRRPYIAEQPEKDGAEDEDDDTQVESTGSSSFTALLAASRRLAGSSLGSSVLTETSLVMTASTLDSPRHVPFTLEPRTRRPTSLPTLGEEANDPATEDDHGGQSTFEPQDGGLERARPITPGGAQDMLRDEDTTKADPAFEEMLEQLPYDLSFLALSVTDLSVRKLLRARDAVAQGGDFSSATSQQDEFERAKPPLSRMRVVRTMLALDTLRLFLLRYEEEEVLVAVTDAVRTIYEQYVRDHGVAPLSHSHCVLTASNIARVVLLVREPLEKKQQEGSLGGANLHHLQQAVMDNNTAERASPRRPRRSGGTTPTSRKSFPGSASPSWRARPSPSGSAPLSPGKSTVSPRPATPASPCSPTSSASSASVRRSILAGDGAHVLLNEKLAVYQHRGDVSRLPSFKVRREGELAVEDAARRRQRSIHYGNEATRALRG